MNGYYLGIEVEVVLERSLEEGWCAALWPNGKVYRHWREQIKTEPWGDTSV